MKLPRSFAVGFSWLLVSFCSLLCFSADSEGKGVLCIRRLAEVGQEAYPWDRHQATRATVLIVQIDKLKPVEVSHESGAIVRDLDLAGPHLLAVRSGGKIIESFWFRFEPAGTDELCLWYTGYGYWSFAEKGHQQVCSCHEVEAHLEIEGPKNKGGE